MEDFYKTDSSLYDNMLSSELEKEECSESHPTESSSENKEYATQKCDLIKLFDHPNNQKIRFSNDERCFKRCFTPDENCKTTKSYVKGLLPVLHESFWPSYEDDYFGTPTNRAPVTLPSAPMSGA